MIWADLNSGTWAGQLGDGRAFSLTELRNPHTLKRYEIQLKVGSIAQISLTILTGWWTYPVFQICVREIFIPVLVLTRD